MVKFKPLLSLQSKIFPTSPYAQVNKITHFFQGFLLLAGDKDNTDIKQIKNQSKKCNILPSIAKFVYNI